MQKLLKALKEKKTDIFFILYFMLCFALSASLMTRLAITLSKSLGISVGADLLLCSVISLGLLRGKKYASIYAIVVGFMYDVYIGNPFDFSPLVYFLCAYLSSHAASPFSRKTPMSVAITAAMLVWIKSLFSFFYLIAVSGESGIGHIVLLGVLPEYILNIIGCAVCFAVMRILMAIFKIPTREDIQR